MAKRGRPAPRATSPGLEVSSRFFRTAPQSAHLAMAFPLTPPVRQRAQGSSAGGLALVNPTKGPLETIQQFAAATGEARAVGAAALVNPTKGRMAKRGAPLRGSRRGMLV